MALEIRKKSLKVWQFIDTVNVKQFIPSKFSVNTLDSTVTVVYKDGANSETYNLSDVELYDLGTITPFPTFVTIQAFMLKLEQMNCPCFPDITVIPTAQGLQETIDTGDNWESTSGDTSITINEDNLFYEAYDPVEETLGSLNINKDGRTILNSDYKASSLSRIVSNTIGSRANGFLHLLSDIKDYSLNILRRSEIIFYEATGIRIASHVGGTGFGVNITTDNLTSEVDVQFDNRTGQGIITYKDKVLLLEGTQVGNPVTGDIEFDNLNGNKKIKGNSSGNYIEFLDDGRIAINNGTGSNVVIQGIDFNGGSGIESSNDFSNINPSNPLIYAQRSYVDRDKLLRVIEPTSPVTGTTAETVLYTWFVPANTLSTLDRFMINEFTVVSNGTLLANATLRIRFNTTSTVDTTTNNKLFATAVLNSGSGNRYASLERAVNFIDTKIKGYFNLAGSFTDKASSVYAENTFDTTVDNWFFFTVQNGNIADSTYMKNLIIRR